MNLLYRCALLVALAGCAAIPLESRGIPHPSDRAGPAFQVPYREVVGVIHIHSTDSDGMLPIEKIARIAQNQELDFLIFTEHDTLKGRREGKQGFYGETLVLIDTEISTKGGHYLALRLKEEVARRKDPRWTIEAVSAQGGLGFIAHPFWRRKPWKDLEVRGVTGLEIYSAIADATEENLLWIGFWTIFAGSELTVLEWLDRSDQALALWDRMLARGDRIVGIGSPDAHGLRRFGLHLAPYGSMFKLVRNHLFVSALTPEGIYECLAKGRLFVAHDILADARGFLFLAVRGRPGSVAGRMGDEVQWRKDLQLYAYLPSPGEMLLFKDGQPIQKAQGQHGWFEIPGPGIYRLESTRKGKPWIYSNPIYVIE